ncbi:MAG: DUF1080 domain-containing protein [Acidobacteriota bacterium]
MPRACFSLIALLLSAVPAVGGGWVKLLNGKNLDGWQPIGEGVWTAMRDGTLVGQCDPRQPCAHQAWLYTRKEFGEFDLSLEFWTRLGGNSGISIRDSSRARWAVGAEWDRNRTPSHIGYEIQITNGYQDSYGAGSIYLLDKAREPEVRNDWNLLEIESRLSGIRVKLNGRLVSQHPGLPDRPKAGPIGLQLHDRNSVIMFRDIRIRER